jgi:hypothetical protein
LLDLSRSRDVSCSIVDIGASIFNCCKIDNSARDGDSEVLFWH